MYIMGINALYHESSVCLLKDGIILATVEEERFNRIKHAKQARVDNPDELPLHSIRYCLETANVTLEDIAYIGYSTSPTKWKQAPLSDEMNTSNSWGTFAGTEILMQKLALIPDKLAEMGFRGEFSWIDHHTAHAASAFQVSPFEKAAVLTVDGAGEENSTAFFEGDKHKLNFLQDIEMPASLGFLWELISVYLGFGVYDAAKLMGLAAYGQPESFAPHFKKVVKTVADGKFEMDEDILRFGLTTYYPPSCHYQTLETLFDIKRRQPGEILEQSHMDIAASLQLLTNEITLHMVKYLYQKTGIDNLCLAGGVALNCVTNRYIFEEGPFTNFYVQSASHDGGTAIGAAFYIWNHLLENKQRYFMDHAYLGPSFSNTDIEEALQTHQLKYKRLDNIEQVVAQLICEDNIIGFFQGRMEVGPRALGNRSLVADPRNPNMRQILNEKVKHREYFRPFAPSVLHEAAKDWFDIIKETPSSDFMLLTYPVKAHAKDKIPAVTHVDGTSRLQTVREETNPRYHKLISEFYKITGVPIVLNTSFNDSEPIVCTPQDAIHTFLKTNIDYLAIGDFIVSKTENKLYKERD